MVTKLKVHGNKYTQNETMELTNRFNTLYNINNYALLIWKEKTIKFGILYE